MKRLFLVFVSVFLLSASFAQALSYDTARIRIEPLGLVANVEVADTFRKRMVGLMHRTDLPQDHGMFFTGQRFSAFWMKDTPLPLDILFVNQDKKITRIVAAASPCFDDECPLYWAPRNTRYVLEFQAGWSEQHQVGVGDQLVLPY